MLNFKPITLEDRPWIEERLKAFQSRGCEYSFGNIFIWQKPNDIVFADVLGFYCLKSGTEDQVIYTYPAGSGDVKPVIEALIKDAEERGIPFRLRAVTEEKKEELERLFPQKFEFIDQRGESDYIYTTEKLSTLSGKKLHGKRNHIARFKDNPNWQYEDITRENLEECRQMSIAWCEVNDCFHGDTELKHEICAVKEAFQYYFELGLVGGALRLDGKIIAFTMGEPLNDDTFVVHIEKAFADIQGAYPMINQQFVLRNCQNFQYVNREEDMGDEGLRKAKMSYRPDILLTKYHAVLKENRL